ncbi:CMD domain-containing protein [Atlantibacter sp.]|uniref:carboxymuconolactone decarboxylase family protein n=1 Tax=Atlantibacter sp. TaxID=1903473 RepID=UPI0028B0CC2A|nr:CMD domain-containing protein [Atlantibacter sp.]
MEQRRRETGRNHWYHETQSSRLPDDVVSLVPEAAHVQDRFLLDLTVEDDLVAPHLLGLSTARKLSALFFPDRVVPDRLNTLSSYDRLSTALTVAQVCGVQRLCNHYAARLTPLPGPDSSRESNRRLTLITQYARQLASQPTLIDSHLRQQLDEAGLSTGDIVTFNHIIGFVGFQARVVAAFQAAMGIPVRWLPGFDMQQDAPAERFHQTPASWRADLPQSDTPLANDKLQERFLHCAREPLLRELAGLLIQDPLTIEPFVQLSTELRPSQDIFNAATLATLVSARINGSVACFNDAAEIWSGDTSLPEAVRNGERALNAWSHHHSAERAIIQATQWLTRAPDRFSQAHFQPLIEQGLSCHQALRLLIWVGFCGWLNRLKLGFGDIG